MIKWIAVIILLAQSAFGQLWVHPLKSAKSDTSATDLVQASDWNDFHYPNMGQMFFVKDDFVGSGLSGAVGELGWNISVSTGTTLGCRNGEANHPGIDSLNAGTTSNNGIAVLLSTGFGKIVPLDLFDVMWIVKLIQTDNATVMRVGLMNSTSGLPSDGVYIEKDSLDTQWFGVCRAASVQTRTASLGSTDTNWHKFRIKAYRFGVADDSVGFSIDGGTELRIKTNKPTVAIIPSALLDKNGTTTKQMYVDYFQMTVLSMNR